jgi:acetyltransferase-like isoleucine patch superfamily enzyme
MSNSHVEQNTVVGASAIVVRDLPPNVVHVGSSGDPHLRS